MFEQLNEIFQTFQQYAKNNPVIAGAMSLWGLGVITFIVRGIPTKIFNFIKRQLSTTLTLNSQDNVYYEFLKWATARNMHSFVRTLNFNNKKHGYGDKSIDIGYGKTFFFYKWRLFFMNRFEVEASQTERMKERIDVTAVGRNHKIFQELFNEITQKAEADENYVRLFTWETDFWSEICKQYKRSLDSISLRDGVKEKICNHIETFASKKDWYIKHGIPYHTGILLYGPPGTGKTSLIKALASEYDKKLYLLNISAMTDKSLQNALAELPENSLVVIEDIDAGGVDLKRKVTNKKTSRKSRNAATRRALKKARATGKSQNIEDFEEDDDDSSATPLKFLTIGGILNAIDGIASAENRILIATTNHPDKLDPALLREGRFDLKAHIDYMDSQSLAYYLNRFYDNFEMPTNYQINDKIPASKVQQLIFENMTDYMAVLKEVGTFT